MYKLQVIADKLNIRSTPEADPSFANWMGDMIKGETYTALKKVKGGIFEGTDEWFVDQNNLFTSAASTSINAQEYINDRFDGQNVLEPIDYNFLLNINEDLRQTKGRGITIGILDHAIARNIKLKSEIIRPFPVESPIISHGSFIAGIIAGTDKILGIAPEATIVELPIYDEFGNLRDPDIITNIFEFIRSFPQDIILNVSQSLRTSFTTRFAQLQNAVIIAAAGFDDMLVSTELIVPARLPNTISVGSISKEFKTQNTNILFNKRLDFIFPTFEFVSYSSNKDSFELLKDTSSLTTAIVSGLTALIYSNTGLTVNLNAIRERISLLAQPYNEQDAFVSLNPINKPK